MFDRVNGDDVGVRRGRRGDTRIFLCPRRFVTFDVDCVEFVGNLPFSCGCDVREVADVFVLNDNSVFNFLLNSLFSIKMNGKSAKID